MIIPVGFYFTRFSDASTTMNILSLFILFGSVEGFITAKRAALPFARLKINSGVPASILERRAIIDPMTKDSEPVTPAMLVQTALSFMPTRVLLTAVQLNLFTTLEEAKDGSMTNDEIRECLNLHKRALPDFTDALVSLKILDREGDGENARYSNSRDASFFLVKGKETYIKELEKCSDIYYRDLIALKESLKDKQEEFVDYGLIKTECIRATNEKMSKAQRVSDASPDYIIDIGFGFWPSRLMLTATELELFTVLDQSETRKMTSTQVSNALGLGTENTRKFLDSLVSLDMLNCERPGDTTLYFNTPATEAFLLKSNFESYIGGLMEMFSSRLYGFWFDLADGLKTGKAQNEAKNSTWSFDSLYEDQDRLEQFMMAMMGSSAADLRLFAQKIDFSPYKTLVDTGGATGQLASYVAQENPHMMCTSIDLPAVIPIAERCIEKWGVADRVKAVACNFFEEDIPKADIITMSRILHDWGLEAKLSLIKKAYDALPSNGVLVAIESIIDDERRVNTNGLLISLCMLIETGEVGGFDFSHADFNKWCLQVGFKRTECFPLVGTSAVFAYK